MPLSLPKPLSDGGILVGSAGRATGRVEGPEGAAAGLATGGAFWLVAGRAATTGFGAVDGFGAEEGLLAVDRLPDDAFGRDRLDAAPEVRLTAERLPSALPARVEVDDLRAVLRLGLADLDLGLLAARLASVFPARFAVMRFDEELGFFAVERLAADFFVADFFFAGISPPSGGDEQSPVGLSADDEVRCFLACYSIGSSQRQAVSAPSASPTR
jgi:hypothetical protein